MDLDKTRFMALFDIVNEANRRIPGVVVTLSHSKFDDVIQITFMKGGVSSDYFTTDSYSENFDDKLIRAEARLKAILEGKDAG